MLHLHLSRVTLTPLIEMVVIFIHDVSAGAILAGHDVMLVNSLEGSGRELLNINVCLWSFPFYGRQKIVALIAVRRCQGSQDIGRAVYSMLVERGAGCYIHNVLCI